MENRASGRTTRLVDGYIQKLFEEGTTGPIRDHYINTNTHRFLLKKIRDRLNNEHPHVLYESSEITLVINLIEDPFENLKNSAKYYKILGSHFIKVFAFHDDKVIAVIKHIEVGFKGTYDISELKGYTTLPLDAITSSKEEFKSFFNEAIESYKNNYNL